MDSYFNLDYQYLHLDQLSERDRKLLANVYSYMVYLSKSNEEKSRDEMLIAEKKSYIKSQQCNSWDILIGFMLYKKKKGKFSLNSETR